MNTDFPTPIVDLSPAAQGVISDRFRNNNNTSMDGLVNWQTESTFGTNPLITYNYPIHPIRAGMNKTWDSGTPLFVKKDAQMLKTVMDLQMLRYMFYMSRVQKVERVNQEMAYGKEPLRGPRGRGQDFSFLAELDDVRKNIEFIGAGYTMTEPSVADNIMDRTSKMLAYTGGFMMQNFTFHGYSPFPNFWGTLTQNQGLYMLIKPMKMNDTYYSPEGNPVRVPDSVLKAGTLVNDVHFFTRPDNAPPYRCSDVSMLLRAQGEQPPIDDLAWIDWRYDDKGAITYGTLEQGILYRIGYSLHAEVETRQQPHSTTARAAERLQWSTDYNVMFPPIEIRLDIKRFS